MTLKTNKIFIWGGLLVVLFGAGLWGSRHYRTVHDPSNGYVTEEIQPVYGDIANTISTTGNIEPKNRLEIKPAINGRIEKIFVNEGSHVEKGQIVARMSSTERAALLDAARGQGEMTMDYWQNVYKSTPLMSPIAGEVIVRAVEPGQTVTTQDAVVVVSDRLIVNALVDETDIGLVRRGQKAVISLDAYPESRISGVVDHIAYESTVLNNVTVYEVNILPRDIPAYFRAGMSADVEVTIQEKKKTLLLPIEALLENNGQKSVLVRPAPGHPPVETAVTVGLYNTHQAEILEGIDENTTVLLRRQKYVIPEEEGGRNPFSPFSSRKKK